MGRVVVHLDSKPKNRSLLSIVSDFEQRLTPRGVILETHQYSRESNQYEAKLSSLSGTLVIIDENGEHKSSKELATWLESAQLSSKTTHLAIGPPDGFSKHLKKSANSLISLSRLTLTHEMSAALLLEQLYRASEINKGSSYHRE